MCIRDSPQAGGKIIHAKAQVIQLISQAAAVLPPLLGGIIHIEIRHSLDLNRIFPKGIIYPSGHFAAESRHRSRQIASQQGVDCTGRRLNNPQNYIKYIKKQSGCSPQRIIPHIRKKFRKRCNQVPEGCEYIAVSYTHLVRYR